MNNMIKIFESKEFGKVRTVVRNGETWWILKDICRVLEMKANSAERSSKDLIKMSTIQSDSPIRSEENRKHMS